MRYFSMFSGIGGFELAIQNSIPDAECIGFSEINKYATQCYLSHFPNHKNYGDATTIIPEQLPDFDLLVGGFPCQAFSIAGKRKGFEDTRGTLFFDIARILKTKQPPFVLLENVKGLMSHNEGETLKIILFSLQELGYYVNIEIRNSKDYGVPQNRERIFFSCKHIKLLGNIGQNEKMTSLETIIQEWLFQILLQNLKEAKKVQGIESKDWVLGYLICQEIYQNPNLLGESILDGISIATEGGLFQSQGNPWQNIDLWLKKTLEENLEEQNTYTISTVINSIIESKTYSFLRMFQAILLATVLLRKSLNPSWTKILLNLILIQNNTKYERINNQNEKTIVTESGDMYNSCELQDFSKNFIVGHLGGFGGRQIFPIREGNESSIVELNNPKHSNNRLFGINGISPTLNTMQGGNRQPKIANCLDANYAKGNSASSTRHTPRTVIPVLTPDRPEKRQNGRRFKEDGEPSFTLTAQDKHGVYDGMKIRRLTPMECERLQGFPDNWTFMLSDSQRYKCCGNAVTVNVVEHLIQNLFSEQNSDTIKTNTNDNIQESQRIS